MKRLKSYRFYTLLLCIQVLPYFAHAQKKKEVIKSLFYNLPIDLRGEELIKKIKENPFFNTFISSRPPELSANLGPIYYGKIDLENYPADLPKPESATLQVNGNQGYIVETEKDFYTSDLKIEYLFTNEELAETYFSYAWDKIKSLSKDTSDAQFGFRDEEDYSYGKSIKLLKRKILPEIYILKRESGNKVYVSLIYRREGY
jgi:hypothetical protein